ncbi:hypothetical protein ACHAWT_008478, partial [Skeletonema menzelii]
MSLKRNVKTNQDNYDCFLFLLSLYLPPIGTRHCIN